MHVCQCRPPVVARGRCELLETFISPAAARPRTLLIPYCQQTTQLLNQGICFRLETRHRTTAGEVRACALVGILERRAPDDLSVDLIRANKLRVLCSFRT